MTWAVKLKEKLVSPLDAWEEVPNEDPKDISNTKSLVKLDDLVLAVLEKNKEIVENSLDMIKMKRLNQTTKNAYKYSYQARAFRELVEACSKASGDARKGIEEMEKVKQK